MNFQFVSSYNLKCCPSVIDVVSDKEKLFIIGSYKLITNDSEKYINQNNLKFKNYRIGYLILWRDKEIIYEYECEDGGIFDMKLSKHKEIFTAHSNGAIGIYYIEFESIQIKRKIQTNSTMLTSLCYVELINSSKVLIAGDNNGCLLVYHNFYLMSSIKTYDSPLWCVYPFEFNGNDRFIFIIGSECGQLIFYYIESPQWNPKILKRNNDALAGVTSISIHPLSIEKKDITNIKCQMYVGSYDENIRIYSLKVQSSSNDKYIDLKVDLVHNFRINDSGIWKLIPLEAECYKNLFLVAGMFSNAHIIKDFDVLYSFQTHPEFSKYINKESEDISKPLIYAVTASSKLDIVLICSFYQQILFLFEKKD